MRSLCSVDDANLHSTAGRLGFDIDHRRLLNEDTAAIVVRAFHYIAQTGFLGVNNPSEILNDFSASPKSSRS